jgi:hypothetical protein
LGLGQNDQVHGIYTQWAESDWDLGLHVFIGNLLQESSLRQKGFSVMSEHDFGEKNRLGFSLIQFDTDALRARRVAIHDRWGLPNSPGSSLMAELGWKEDMNKTTGSLLGGSYGLIEGLFRIKRGYNFLTTVERTQAETSPSSPDVQRWSFGVLTFPLQRTEVRAAVVQSKSFSTETVSGDVWAVQGQVHVSW